MTLHDRDALFQRHQALALWLARHVGGPGRLGITDDLEQEALLALWEATRQYDPIGHPGVPFPMFARRVIRCSVLKAIEAERRQGLVAAPAGVERERVDVDALGDSPRRNDLADVLFDAIGALDPIEQRLICLRTGLDGSDPLSLLECASELGLSFATAKRLVAKARDSIRSQLQREGMDPDRWVTLFPRKASVNVS